MISSFKLSYYTMLNMLRRLEGSQHNMEYVIKNSFQQFQQERALPEVGVFECMLKKNYDMDMLFLHWMHKYFVIVLLVCAS